MDLEEIGINASNWVDSAQDRDYWRALVNALNLRVSQLVRYKNIMPTNQGGDMSQPHDTADSFIVILTHEVLDLKHGVIATVPDQSL